MYNNSNGSLSEKEDKLKVNTNIVSAVIGIIMFLTLIGNSLVLISFCVQTCLRRVKYFPVISLALADILCALTAMPLYITKKSPKVGQVDAILVCDLYRFTYFFTEYASVTSLMVISVERFLTVKFPLRYRDNIRGNLMIGVLVLCWMEALFVSTMPFYWRNKKLECRNSPTRTWSLIVLSVNVLTPFFIMLACQLYIYCKTLLHFRCNYIAQHQVGRSITQFIDSNEGVSSSAYVKIYLKLGE